MIGAGNSKLDQKLLKCRAGPMRYILATGQIWDRRSDEAHITPMPTKKLKIYEPSSTRQLRDALDRCPLTISRCQPDEAHHNRGADQTRRSLHYSSYFSERLLTRCKQPSRTSNHGPIQREAQNAKTRVRRTKDTHGFRRVVDDAECCEAC